MANESVDYTRGWNDAMKAIHVAGQDAFTTANWIEKRHGSAAAQGDYHRGGIISSLLWYVYDERRRNQGRSLSPRHPCDDYATEAELGEVMTEDNVIHFSHARATMLFTRLVANENFETMCWLQSLLRRWDGSREHLTRIRECDDPDIPNPVRFQDLSVEERAVVETGLLFQQAETAHWIESEVGSDPARTHHERGVAYIKFVAACDDLLAARKEQE